MFTKKIHFASLQNDEHYAFNSYFDELITLEGAEKLKVQEQYAAYKILLANEREALDLIVKSTFTVQIDTADTARDNTINGFFKVVNGMLHHFNPAVSGAAYRIKVINESFSSITRIPYESQTTATLKFIDSLKAASSDIAVLSLTDWVTEIEDKNNAFASIMKTRFDEKDNRTSFRMKDVRTLVDEAYNKINDRINAFITLEGDTVYATYITKLNNRIDSFSNTVALRKGRSKQNNNQSDTVN